MKKNKLSESQMFSMLNEVEAGMSVNDVCRKYGVANSTYYKLKSKYAGMSPPRAKAFKAA
jgi:putative transposase